MRPFLRNAIGYWLLLATPLFAVAAEPSQPTSPIELSAEERIAAPSISPRDRPVKINHPAGATIQAIYVADNGKWAFLAEPHFIRHDEFTIFAAPANTYLVTTGDSTILKIVDDGDPEPDPPDPKPEPEPEPEPGPQPIVAKWAIWIEEQSERAKHVEQTRVATQAKTRGDLIGRGIQPRIYDDDQQAAQPFLPLTDGRPLPVLVLYDEVAKEHRSFPAPKTKEELERIIRENVVR